MRLLALLLLLPSLAAAQGLSSTAPWQTGGKTLMDIDLSTTGALITDDANTVAHVYWNGTALVDSKGNSWTMTGTVPQVAVSPFVATRYGAGPFSSSNYYSLASPNPLQFAGDFTCHAVFVPSVAGNNLVASVWNGNGWTVRANTSVGYLQFYSNSNNLTTGNAPVLGGPNVASWGRSGGSHYAKLNLGTVASSVSGYTQPAGVAAALGYSSGESVQFSGSHYELACSTTPFTDAAATAIQQKVLGHLYGSTALSVTRTTTATVEQGDCTAGQCVWTVPAGVARVSSNGLLVESQRTNYVLQSGTISTGTAATSPWSLSNATVATVAGDPAGGSWAEVTSTTTGSVGAYQVAATASSATFVVSAWARKASGTGVAGVMGSCLTGAVPACTCVRSDGGACSASVQDTTDCIASVSDLGTTPVRISSAFTCNAAKTSIAVYLIPGAYKSSTGTTRFSMAQLEVGSYPTSYIPTTTTSAARNADQVSVANPIPTGTANWCVAGDYKPYGGRAWPHNNTLTLWSLGSKYAANSFLLSDQYLYSFDASSGQKYTDYSLTTGSSHRLVSCTAAGLLSVYTDGTSTSGTSAGTGAGTITLQPATLYLGVFSDGTAQFNGFLKSLKVCKAKSAKDCK